MADAGRLKNLNDLLIARFSDEQLRDLPAGFRQLAVEIGTGSGQHTRMLRKHFARVVTTDVEIRAIGIDCLADVCALPFATSCADVIVMTEVLEHVPEPSRAIAEVARVTREGGYLLISTPFLHGLHEMPQDFWRFTEFALARLLEQHGFRIQRLNRRGALPSLIVAALTMLAVGGSVALERIPGIGRVFCPVRRFVQACVELIHRVEAGLVATQAGARPSAPGDSLQGIAGTLYQWPLGYVVLARRVVA